jgi:hypothetical protein
MEMGEFESNMRYAKSIGADTRKPLRDMRTTSKKLNKGGNKMKKVNCDLTISALVECPNNGCNGVFDLFEMQSLTDDDYLYKELLSSDGFGQKNFGEIVQCPFCKTKFIIGDVKW